MKILMKKQALMSTNICGGCGFPTEVRETERVKPVVMKLVLLTRNLDLSRRIEDLLF